MTATERVAAMRRGEFGLTPKITLEPEGEIESETLIAEAGAYALTLSTSLPTLAVSLHSSYLGHPRAAATQVAELALGPVPRARAAHARSTAPACPCSTRDGAA